MQLAANEVVAATRTYEPADEFTRSFDMRQRKMTLKQTEPAYRR